MKTKASKRISTLLRKAFDDLEVKSGNNEITLLCRPALTEELNKMITGDDIDMGVRLFTGQSLYKYFYTDIYPLPRQRQLLVQFLNDQKEVTGKVYEILDLFPPKKRKK